jgi:hypothetical protein
MAGLALLTKGPAAIIIIGITGMVFLITNAFRNFFSIPQLLLFTIVASITAGLWLGIDFLQNGNQFIREFTIRQWELFTTKDAGHGGFFFYHFVVLFFGCFPVSAFFIHAMLKKDNEENPRFINFKKWMKILFWVVLILFSIVQTKIVHYSSLCYYPISFFAAIISSPRKVSQKLFKESKIKIFSLRAGSSLPAPDSEPDAEPDDDEGPLEEDVAEEEVGVEEKREKPKKLVLNACPPTLLMSVCHGYSTPQ